MKLSRRLFVSSTFEVESAAAEDSKSNYCLNSGPSSWAWYVRETNFQDVNETLNYCLVII